MKTTESIKAAITAVTIVSLIGTTLGSTILTVNNDKKYVSENVLVLKDSELNIKPAVAMTDDKGNIQTLAIEENGQLNNLAVAEGLSQEEQEREAKKNQVVYDGLTLEELAAKLNKTLHSTIANQGYTFASYAIELGIDPYLAVAIVMHETGCQWECSTLLKQCNNVGGMKSGGTGKCNGGSYASFPSLEEGIRAYMNNLYKNYVSQGLTTAEAMGPKYAASPTWASQVNAYINKIKAA